MQNRRLSAIMFTDIVGYTTLMGEDEQKAFGLLAENRRIHKPLINEFNGRWIKEIGDGILASFHTATEAVACAIEIRKACAQIPHLQLRIGIHLGEVVSENKDIFGNDVNIASRLQAMASPGSIWISEQVYKNIANKRKFRTKFVKEEHLKHVKEPVKIYRVESDETESAEVPKAARKVFGPTRKVLLVVAPLVILAGIIYYLLSSAGSKPSDKSIAVLYFDNMSGNPQEEYFSDGITEEIIANLSRIPDLRVVSRTSVFPYKGKGKNIRQIAKELNVSTILEGSVRKSGNRVKISAQLIDAGKDKHLWSEEFERELKDVFEIQSSVARSIADKFEIHISPAANRQLNNAVTTNSFAYDYYLKAKAEPFEISGFGIGTNTSGRDRAVLYLKRAIEYDPRFAKAHALLSEIYTTEYFSIPEKRHMLDSALVLARKAIRYNKQEVAGYLALAKVETYVDERKVLPLLKMAYRLDPAAGLMALAGYYQLRGDYPEAMKYISFAERTQPTLTEPLLLKAGLYNDLGLSDSCLNYLTKAKTLDPLEKQIFLQQIEFYEFKGDVKSTTEAAELFFGSDTLGINKEIAIAYLIHRDWKNAYKYYKNTEYRDMDYGFVLMKMGRQDSAMIYIDKAIAFRMETPRPWQWDLSRLYAIKGDVNRAVYYFKEGRKAGIHIYDWVKNDPYWDAVRHTPEFEKAQSEFYKRNSEMISRIRLNEQKKTVPALIQGGT